MQGNPLEVIAREWSVAHGIIADFLRELNPSHADEVHGTHASAIIARLAHNDPPILLEFMEADE